LPTPEEVAGDEEAGLTRVAKPIEETGSFITSYYEFPGNFTTNLRGSRKFLQVGIGVSTQYDETVVRNVEMHQLALRSEILGVISEFTEEDVSGKSGRDAIALRMRDAINAKLEELEGFGGVEGVHFTSFVLQ
jgi:flagellar FliL protein